MEYFVKATPYRSRRTENEEIFTYFRDYIIGNSNQKLNLKDHIIQFKFFPNFTNNHNIKYYKYENGIYKECGQVNRTYVNGNSYKNYNTLKGIGHDKGYFYEVNLFFPNNYQSSHHISTKIGNTYTRDSSSDGILPMSKGKHWTYA